MNKIQKRIEDILEEDLVNYSTGNSASGYDWYNRKEPVQMSLVDILKLDRNDWEKALNALPYQIQPVFQQILTIIDDNESIIGSFDKAITNPLIKTDESKISTIKRAKAKLKGIKKAYTEVIELIDNLNRSS